MKAEGGRFCSENCHAQGMVVAAATEIPAERLRDEVAAVIEGECPRCGGPGPVDVFTSHRVWSAAVVTSWRSEPAITCRGCATRRQLGGALSSLLLGWWGFPWGLLMTPVQISRNLVGLSRDANPYSPSPQLEELVRLCLASEGFGNEAAHERAA